MQYSNIFGRTNKSAKEFESVNATLLQKAGYIDQVMAGVYTFLPLGLRVLNNIEQVIRDEMNAAGAQELLMPVLHPKENWEQSGRWDTLDVLFKLKSKHGHEIGLGPTHEEVITPLAAKNIFSYGDLPQSVYQIQTKFRDEARAKSGLLRGREFRMKDLYSFHRTEADLAAFYEKTKTIYKNIFQKLGLETILTEASGGTFSKYSHEFQAEVDTGEDVVYVCTKCQLAKNKEIYEAGVACTDCGGTEYREASACEVGNIFQLKTKFSNSFNLVFTDEAGQPQPVQMGCYGIGSSRIMGVLVEKFHDDKGIIWPERVAPFKVHLLALNYEQEPVVKQVNKIYQEFSAHNIEVLFDDRINVSAGEKFADSDLIGIPWRVVVSKKTGDQIEVKRRDSNESSLQNLSEFLKAIT